MLLAPLTGALHNAIVFCSSHILLVLLFIHTQREKERIVNMPIKYRLLNPTKKIKKLLVCQSGYTILSEVA